MEEEENSRPLRGAIVCCTSIPPEQRSELAGYAEQMGAIHKFDLTSDVTHLIVGDIDTPKYKFVARERLDVKCVLVDWLTAVREAWMTENEVNVAALEQQYSLPPLAAMNICLTGFLDPDERKSLETKIISNGGNYMPNLTRDEHFLIAKEPSGAKYDFAVKWGVKIVSVEWLDQCIERGMILEHTSFHPSCPPEKRGLGAWIRRTESTTSLEKRPAEDAPREQRSRKLRRTASAKLESQNSGLWGDISLQDEHVEKPKESEWDKINGDDSATKPLQAKEPASVKDSVDAAQQYPTKSLLSLNQQQDDIFKNKVFVLYGFSEQQAGAIEKHVRSRGGALMDFAIFESGALTSNMSNVHVLVPHKTPFTKLPRSIQDLPSTAVGTEFWIERCMHLKHYEEPTFHSASRPFRNLPLTGFANQRISITGFKGFEILHTSKAIKALGGIHEQDFSSEVSLLLCHAESVSIEKLRHAQLWGVPAVNVEWLWKCQESGEMVDYTSYLMQPIALKPKDQSDAGWAESVDQAKRAQDRTDNRVTKANVSKTREPPRKAKRASEQHTKQKASEKAPIPPYEPDPFADSAGPTLPSQPDDESTPMQPRAPLPKASSPSQSSPQPSQSSLPLREITPNTSPPKPLAPQKHPSPPQSPSPVTSFDPCLSETITSLLAQRKSASASRPVSASGAPTRGRRRRTLLGRAPSNLSCTSQMSNSGDPVSQQSGKVNGSSNVVYDADTVEEEERARQAEQMMLTQVGYQEPEQEHYRKKIETKMRAAKKKNKVGGVDSGAADNGGGTAVADKIPGEASMKAPPANVKASKRDNEKEDEAEFEAPKSVKKQYGTRTTPRRAAAAVGNGVRAAFGNVTAAAKAKVGNAEGPARRTRGATGK